MKYQTIYDKQLNMFIVNDELIKKQEDKGRDIFFTCCPNMSWTENQDKFGIWDLKGNSESSEMYVEIKNRDIKSTSYSTSFLELKKYNNLLELANNSTSKTKVYYFVTYADNVSYLFDLTKLKMDQIQKSKIWMKEVSLAGQDKMVQKEVIELPLAVAKKKYTITYA